MNKRSFLYLKRTTFTRLILKILQILAAWNSLQFKTPTAINSLNMHISVFRQGMTTNKKGVNRLHLQSRGCLEGPILDALDTIPVSILHPKLKILQRFLLADNNTIAYACGSSRQTYYQYLGNDLEDKLLLVLGQ